MRKSILRLCFVVVMVNFGPLAYSQNFFNYQAVVRDADGRHVSNKEINIRLSLIKGDLFGELVYQEQHASSTSEFGTITIAVGGGTPTSGDFSAVNWGQDSHFLRVEIQLSGDDSFTEIGTSQILAVPVALYSLRSGDNFWIREGENISTSNSVGVGVLGSTSKLAVAGIIESTEGGVKFPDGTVQPSAVLGSNFLNTSLGPVYLSDTNVGVGVTNPSYPLSVAGVVESQSGGFRFPDGSIQQTAVFKDNFLNISEGPLYLSGSNVGIGVSSPGHMLSVAGIVESKSGGIKFPDGTVQTSAASGLGANFFNKTEGPLYADSDYIGVGTPTPTTNFEVSGDGSSNYEPVVFRNNYTMNLLAYASGDVDFLNSSFVSNRSRGTYESPENVQDGDRVGGFYARYYYDGSYRRSAGIQMYVGSGTGSGSYPSLIKFETTGEGEIERSERMRITESGNVGIGTETPESVLTVNGTIETLDGGIKFPDGTVQTSAASGLGANFFNKTEGPLYADSDYIGVGTPTPTTNFEVSGDGSSNYEPVVFRNNYTMNLLAYASGDVDFLNSSFVSNRSRGTYESPENVQDGDRVGGFYARYYYDGSYRRSAGIQMYVGSGTGSGSYPSLIKFETTGEGEIERSERMRITESGNVGIGTETPESVLTVNGTIETLDGGIKFPDGTVQTSAASGLGANFFNKTEGPLYADSDYIGVGTQTPTTNFEVSGDGSSNYEPVVFRNNYTMNLLAYASGDVDFLNSSFVSNRSRGTYESPENVQDGDRVGGFYARYYYDGSYRRSAGIQMYVGSGTGSGSYPSLIKFETTGEGEIERSERMRITESGNVGIGTETPESVLTVNGTIETLDGGIKFPDGTVQTSAANINSLITENATDVVIETANLGVGVLSPVAKVHVSEGDIYIDDATKGVIMKSPNGSCWRMTVDDSGVAVFASITCPED